MTNKNFHWRLKSYKSIPEKEPQNFISEEMREGARQERERKDIEAIERLPLDFQDKTNLLLVYLQEKPAAWLGPSFRSYKTETRKEREEKFERLDREKKAIEGALEDLGLPYYFHSHGADEEKTILVVYDFIVGQDSKKLNHLMGAVKNKSVEDIGSALGYPESAVEGFINNRELDEKDLEQLSETEKIDLGKEGVFKFFHFVPSKDNWRKELELARKYQRVIKEKSPQIYNEVMESALDLVTKSLK